MELNCISCGHRIHLDDAYENYKGLIKCWICGSLLEVAINEAQLVSISLQASDRAQAEPAQR